MKVLCSQLGLATLACTSLIALGSNSALAQAEAQAQTEGSSGGIEEIVVTAQRRSENLQQTPIAITAMTADSLTAQGITGLTGIVQAAPSLYFAPYPSSSTTLLLFMRGQGIGDPQIITKDGGVGLYVDGVYQSRPQASAFDLADVERVEVLRGPQGQLYGRNTTGGAVNIISRKPTGEFAVRGQLSGGNYDYGRALVTMELPQFGDFKAKVTGLFSTRDGWAKNAADVGNTPAAHDFQTDRKIAVRGAVRWEPSADLTVDYVGDYSHSRSTPPRFVNEAPFVPFLFPGYTADPERAYRPVNLPYGTTVSDGQALTIEYRPSSSLTLRSITAYRHVDFDSSQDYVEAFLVPFVSFDHVGSKTWTQELQAIGDIGDEFNYVFGLYYYDERANHFLLNDSGTGTAGELFMTDRDITAKSISKAAYGQVTWTPGFADDKLDLTLGGRFTSDKRTASRSTTNAVFIGETSQLVRRQFNGAGFTLPLGTIAADARIKNEKFNPAFTVTYKPANNVTAYAKVVTGYKGGGVHTGSPSFRTFGPESVTSYEIGLKTDLLDRRVRLNIDGFIANYSDLQVDLSADAANPSIIETFNVGKATVKGIEADLTVMPIDGVTLQGSYNYTTYKISGVLAPENTIFDPAISPGAPTPVGGDISNFFVLPFTPEHSLRLSGDWQVGQVGPGMVALHADYTWKDKVFTTSGVGPAVPAGRDFPVNPSYGIVDGRISYTIERDGGRDISIALWGKNITNNRYAGFNIGFGSALTGYTAQAKSYADPVTYGIDVGFSF
jgi:iron complex outermembrane recepter protein